MVSSIPPIYMVARIVLRACNRYLLASFPPTNTMAIFEVSRVENAEPPLSISKHSSSSCGPWALCFLPEAISEQILLTSGCPVLLHT